MLSFRAAHFVAIATCLALASPALAQTAPATPPTTPAATQPAATPEAPKADAKAETKAEAKAARRQAPDNAQKKACDKKWKAEKAKTKAVGWKPYFVYMAGCM